MTDTLFERGLPQSLDCERFILGSILLNNEHLAMVAAEIEVEDFAMEKHRRIFLRIRDVAKRGAWVDRFSVADELIAQGQLESVDGLSYLVSLDDGLPDLPNIDSYVRRVKEKSVLRRTIRAFQGGIEQCMASDTPSAEILARAEAVTRELSKESGSQGFKTVDQVFHDGGGVNEFLFPPQGLRRKCVATPWPTLNAMLYGGGLMPGRMIVIGARPSQGKTTLGCDIAEFAGRNLVTTAFFTLEMSNSQIIQRMAYARSTVNSARHSVGECAPVELERLQVAYADLVDRDIFPLHLQDAVHTLSGMRSALIKLAARGPIGLIVVDYVQLMRTMGRGWENRNSELTVISAGLKQIAQEFDAPIVVLAQLSRGVDKDARRPVPSDLRDCGAIEQDADVILMPYLLPSDQQPQNWYIEPFVDLIVAKQREGSTGVVQMRFQKAYTRFQECGR